MATLSAILTAREKALDWAGKETGLSGQPVLRVYATDQSHSSVEKAVFLSGIGRDNLVAVATDDDGAMDPEALRAAIAADRAAGYVPCALCCVIGGTGVGASDRLETVLPIAREEGLFSHVDAAWAGSALICPEFRHIARGVELADSVVMNPHKWLMTNFDCSAHFVKSVEDFQKTMSITPAYLVTQDAEGITDYSQLTLELGRRFRALKLWFVIRCYGVAGLQEIIRNHVAWTDDLAARIGATAGFEITSTPQLGLFSFRLRPDGMKDEAALESLNARLVDAVNGEGTLYLTQTMHRGTYVIRISVGATSTTAADIDIVYDRIVALATPLLKAAGQV
jgi:aromatic-L-amino-acid decarboxylase